MDEECYIEWATGLQMPKALEIVEVRWRMQTGLSIAVAAGPSNDACLIIEFPQAQAFQSKDEGHRLINVPGCCGFIWQVSNSRYLKAFREDAATTMDRFPLLHWLVMSRNECVDVLSEGTPILTVL